MSRSRSLLHRWLRAWDRLRFGEPVIVVSGLPRSGTSMMMQMLGAGGVPLFTDEQRKPDEENPAGYFELEQVKELDKPLDKSWLIEARGHAIKIISRLLTDLPPNNYYQVLFMRRNMDEVLASQRTMLRRRGEPVDGHDRRMAALFEDHLMRVDRWLSDRPNIDVLYLDYGGILREPSREVRRIAGFLDRPLDVKRMARAVDAKLYRNRAAKRRL